MSDLLVLEGVIALLLLIFIARPFVRRFRGVDGISVLPGIALALSIGLAAAFGFRPEVLPLAFFSLISFVGSLPRLFDIARKLRTDDYGERHPAVAIVWIGVLFACFAFAAIFAPLEKALPVEASAHRFTVKDPSRDVAVSFILEGADQGEPRPLAVFGPPVIGSSGMTKRLRGELAAKGFAVLSYYRVGLDFPAEDERGAIRLPDLKNALDAAEAVLWGNRFAFAAEAGARLEQERLADLRFALSMLSERGASGDPLFASVDCGKVVVVGYGAGGAAALLYASDRPAEFVSSVVAIESPVYSSLELEPIRGAGTAPQSGASIRERAAFLLSSIKARLSVRRVLGPARGTPVIERVPTAMIVSDWIRSIKMRDERYASLVRFFRSARAGCSIVSFAGAGPLHFSDVPSDYPVYVFFARGKDRFVPRSTEFSARVAEVCESLFEGGVERGRAVPGMLIEKND